MDGDELGRERAYGKWLALRGVLRAIEGRVDEWIPVEGEMLERIDWQREQFRFPGIEAFDAPQVNEMLMPALRRIYGARTTVDGWVVRPARRVGGD